MSRRINYAVIVALLAGLLFISYRNLPGVSAGHGGSSTNYILSLSIQGGGKVKLTPFGTTYTSGDDVSYPQGTSVALQAIGTTNWVFDHWEEDLTGTGASRSLTMNGNRDVTAVFVQPVLTVNKEGSGNVQVYLQGSPPGETLTPTFSKTYTVGAQVILIAKPTVGWAFKQWQDDASGTSKTTGISMTGPKTVKAIFEPIKITIMKQGEGTVTVTPPGVTDEPTFTIDFPGAIDSENITLNADPETGWAFEKWTGGYTGTANPATFPISGDKTVTAVFKEIALTVDTQGGGKVQIDPPDITPDIYPHTESFTSATPENPVEVDLVAVEDMNWGFEKWTGDLTTTEASDSVSMDEAKSVTAVFVQAVLTINKNGEGTVTTTPTGDEISDTKRGFRPGTQVTLSAVAQDGWVFSEWTGIVSGTTSTIVINSLDENASVTANFVEISLTVDREGEGTVEISPPDITPSVYPHTEPISNSTPENPVNVQLTATPVMNWGFKKWEGDLTSSISTGSVTMDGAKSVKAIFAQAVLDVDSIGEGRITIDPPDETRDTPFSETFPWGAEVTLTPVPDPGWRFKEWTGSVTRGEEELDPLTLRLNHDHSVTAEFEEITFPLTVTKTGNGEVKANPPNETNVPTFTLNYDQGESVTLTSVPPEALDHWEGDIGTANPNSVSITFEMNGPRSVNAVFKPEYTLSMSKVGGGTVSPEPSPPVHTYREGQVAALSATGNDDWVFDHWSGDASGTSASTSVPMTDNKSATAHFIEGVKITVNKDGEGSVSPGTGVYPKGGTRTFTATPAAGWRWDHWEGDLAGEDPTDSSLELPMDQARTITAFFIEQATLTVHKNLIGNLPANGGELSPVEEEVHLYDIDTEVTLTATPDSGWRFKEWSGDASGVIPSVTIVLEGNKTVTGTFIQRHTVTTEVVGEGSIDPLGRDFDHGETASYLFDIDNHNHGDFDHWSGLPDSFSTPEWGVGTSNSNPVSWSVEDDCHLIGYDQDAIFTLTADVDADGCVGCSVDPEEEDYVQGQTASVTATAGTGWRFFEWTGDVPTGKENDIPLELVMDEDKNVTAVMAREYTLTVGQEGEGTVDPEVGDHVYLRGDKVTLSATPGAGWSFDRWLGDTQAANPEESQIEIWMYEDNTVTAKFLEGVKITVLIEGEGTVSPGTGIYQEGGIRTFTATPAEGWRWDHWEGDLAGEDPQDATLDLPMDQLRTITAYFVEQATLTLHKSLTGNLPANGGALSPTADEVHFYDKGEEVTLHATEDTGWRFAGWTGDLVALFESPTITMSENKVITGSFIQQHSVTTAVHIHGSIDTSPSSLPDAVWDHGTGVSYNWDGDGCFCTFSRWEGLPTDQFPEGPVGPGSDGSPSVFVTINDDYELHAYDDTLLYTLTATVDAPGCANCRVTPENPEPHPYGEEVTVSALEPYGWGLHHWEGDVPEGMETEISFPIIITEDKNVTAVMKQERILTVGKEGNGQVEPGLGQSTYLHGDLAVVQATPDVNWSFSYWKDLPELDFPNGPAGPGTSDLNPLTLPMTDDKSATAVFTDACYIGGWGRKSLFNPHHRRSFPLRRCVTLSMAGLVNLPLAFRLVGPRGKRRVLVQMVRLVH